MLARNPYQCVECGLAMSSPDFVYEAGEPAKGPAYWSDHGVLCSVRCSLAHFLKRREAGDAMRVPAENPLDGLDPGRR